MKAKLAVLLLVPLACGTPASLSAEEFTAHGGCSDVFLYALTQPDTLGVTFSANGLLAEVGSAPRTFTFQLPDPRVKLERLEGTRLSSIVCCGMWSSSWRSTARRFPRWSSPTSRWVGSRGEAPA